MKLSIVIPCYNEAENIPLLLERFAAVMEAKEVEVVLVNNGSTDHTAEVLEALLPKYPFARTVLVKKNQGYGYGILQGLAACKAAYVGWIHADMQTDPADVIRALELVEQQSEPVYIKGRRKGRPLLDRFFTNGMSLFESCYLGVKLSDINAQPNVFPIGFYQSWENPPHDFSLDLYALYLARKQKIKLLRFAVGFPERVYGTSKWNTGLQAKWKFIKRTIAFSVKLKKEGIR